MGVRFSQIRHNYSPGPKYKGRVSPAQISPHLASSYDSPRPLGSFLSTSMIILSSSANCVLFTGATNWIWERERDQFEAVVHGEWNEPARSFSKQNIIGVVRSSLDESYTSIVLPVTHRLLKQRLVRAYVHTKHRHVQITFTLYTTTDHWSLSTAET